MKCDYCDRPAVAYGSHGSYQACDEHLAKGEAAEDAMFSAFEANEPQDYLEFLRET